MMQITKIFRFETAHALHGYDGKCRNLHGHSYELHVTVCSTEDTDDFLPAPGILFDFKDLKAAVQSSVVDEFDHHVILSKEYIRTHPGMELQENLKVWDVEPSAENILLFIRNTLKVRLPDNIQLSRLKLYETANSYAEWVQG